MRRSGSPRRGGTAGAVTAVWICMAAVSLSGGIRDGRRRRRRWRNRCSRGSRAAGGAVLADDQDVERLEAEERLERVGDRVRAGAVDARPRRGPLRARRADPPPRRVRRRVAPAAGRGRAGLIRAVAEPSGATSPSGVQDVVDRSMTKVLPSRRNRVPVGLWRWLCRARFAFGDHTTRLVEGSAPDPTTDELSFTAIAATDADGPRPFPHRRWRGHRSPRIGRGVLTERSPGTAPEPHPSYREPGRERSLPLVPPARLDGGSTRGGPSEQRQLAVLGGHLRRARTWQGGRGRCRGAGIGLAVDGEAGHRDTAWAGIPKSNCSWLGSGRAKRARAR